MADWITTLDGLPGLSAAEKGKARVLLLWKFQKDASLLVSGVPDVAAEAIKEILRQEASAAGLGVGSAAGTGAAASQQGAATAVGAGPLPAIPAATGEDEDVRATIKKRAPCSAKYAVHLTVPASPPYKEAATVVGPRHVATYAHDEHLSWQCEQTIPVAVHCPHEDRRTHVDATVVYHDKDKDVAILEVQRELAAPVLDTAISAGDMYYVHGQSTQAQADATSISHGMVAATELDALSHIRGDITSGKGDSGGGCFSVATGKLMAMVVGSDEPTKKAILVPIAVISSILTDLAAQRRLREQPPGCAA